MEVYPTVPGSITKIWMVKEKFGKEYSIQVG